MDNNSEDQNEYVFINDDSDTISQLIDFLKSDSIESWSAYNQKQ